MMARAGNATTRKVIAKCLQDHQRAGVLGHIVNHQRLEIVGDAQALQIPGNEEHRRLPAKGEQQANEKRPPDPCADECEDGAVCRRPMASMPRSARSPGNACAIEPPPVGTMRKNTSMADGRTSSAEQTRYARYFPNSTALRGMGLVKRYVIVLSSTSSAMKAVP